MKTGCTLLIALLSLTVMQAQTHDNLNTQSVTLDTLISFIADYFPQDNLNVGIEKKDENKIAPRYITFLVETTTNNFSTEDKTILQQAFKFLSKRLVKSDVVSIVTYSGQNGLLLDKASGTNLKKMLYVIGDVKKNLTQLQNDGIALAYQLAQDNLDGQTINSLVIVRNPNPLGVNQAEITTGKPELLTTATADDKTQNKKGSHLLLLTAIAVLPELISIIKD